MMTIDAKRFKEDPSCCKIKTTLYDVIETVGDEIAADDERMLEAAVCYMINDCKARFIGNCLHGTIETHR